jgi:hypothetical protein
VATLAPAPRRMIWDCRYSRLGYRTPRVAAEQTQPEILWVCAREPKRRCVTDEECEDCPEWEEAGEL